MGKKIQSERFKLDEKQKGFETGKEIVQDLSKNPKKNLILIKKKPLR